MSDIPAEFVVGLSQPAREAAARWWDRLTPDDRSAIVALSSTDYAPESAPKIFGGRFLPDDEASGWTDWFGAYFEHLVANPDQVYQEQPIVRTFYIG